IVNLILTHTSSSKFLHLLQLLTSYLLSHIFFFQYSAAHLNLHSFPTRRSSDLDLMPVRKFSAMFSIEYFSEEALAPARIRARRSDRKSTRLNSSHGSISYAVFCLKKKKFKCGSNTIVEDTVRDHFLMCRDEGGS